MPDFLIDDLPAPSDKSDLPVLLGGRLVPAGQEGMYQSADDFNQLKRAVVSLRTGIKAGVAFGMALQGSLPSAAASVARLSTDTNGVTTITHPDGTHTAIADKTGPRGNPFLSGNVFNVKDPRFGAVLDGVTDDTAAIQAAHNAAEAVAVSAPGVVNYACVYFPPGVALITKPIAWTQAGNVSWVGFDRATTTFRRANDFYGPSVIVAANGTYTARPLPLVTSLLTGTGHAMAFDGDDPSHPSEYCIRGALWGMQGALDGATALTVEATIKPTSWAVSDITAVMWSRGTLMAEDGESSAFKIQIDNLNHCAIVKMNIGGTPVQFNTGIGSMTLGTKYHVAGVYSGSTLKVFLDGAQVASMAATGTIRQDWWEDFGIGAETARFPDAGAILSQAFNGVLECPRVSRNIARYTGAFTPSTSKYTPDNFTWFQSNFEVADLGAYCGASSAPMVLKHYAAPAPGLGVAPAYGLVRRTEQSIPLNNIRISELTFFGGSGIEFSNVQASRANNLAFTSSGCALYLENNCFLFSVRDCDFNLSSSHAYAAIVNTRACGLNTFTNCNITSTVSPILGEGFYMHHCYGPCTRPSVIGGSGSDDGYDAILDHVNFVDEGSTSATQHFILRNANVAALNCNVEKTFAVDTSAPIVLSGASNRTYWEACQFNVGAGQDGVFAARVAQTNPVHLNAHTRWGAFGSADPTRPLNSTPSLVRIQDTALLLGMVGASATEVPCRNLSGTATIPSGDDHVDVLFDVEEDDADYRIPGFFISNKATTGFTLTSPAGNVAGDTDVDWMMVR